MGSTSLFACLALIYLCSTYRYLIILNPLQFYWLFSLPRFSLILVPITLADLTFLCLTLCLFCSSPTRQHNWCFFFTKIRCYGKIHSTDVKKKKDLSWCQTGWTSQNILLLILMSLGEGPDCGGEWIIMSSVSLDSLRRPSAPPADNRICGSSLVFGVRRSPLSRAGQLLQLRLHSDCPHSEPMQKKTPQTQERSSVSSQKNKATYGFSRNVSACKDTMTDFSILLPLRLLKILISSFDLKWNCISISGDLYMTPSLSYKVLGWASLDRRARSIKYGCSSLWSSLGRRTQKPAPPMQANPCKDACDQGLIDDQIVGVFDAKHSKASDHKDSKLQQHKHTTLCNFL